MSSENAYRGSGGVPYATRDFLDPILEICLVAHAYLGEKKITPTKKNMRNRSSSNRRLFRAPVGLSQKKIRIKTFLDK